MPLKDQLTNYARKLIENKPGRTSLRSLVQRRKPVTKHFTDDGIVPNHPRWPMVVYRNVFRFGKNDPAVVIDALFDANGWGRSWRDTIYDFVHYHSQVHEVLGVAKGRAVVECGGLKGSKLKLRAGDVVVLPAGTGHRLIEATKDFLVVGAYPPEGTYDECTDTRDRSAAAKRIVRAKKPKADPVYGKAGPLLEIWRRNR